MAVFAVTDEQSRCTTSTRAASTRSSRSVRATGGGVLPRRARFLAAVHRHVQRRWQHRHRPSGAVGRRLDVGRGLSITYGRAAQKPASSSARATRLDRANASLLCGVGDRHVELTVTSPRDERSRSAAIGHPRLYPSAPLTRDRNAPEDGRLDRPKRRDRPALWRHPLGQHPIAAWTGRRLQRREHAVRGAA
jgi:hypothetical protein